MEDSFELYCCLYRKLSVFSGLTPEIVMNLLSTQCYQPLYSMQFANDSMRVAELKHRKQEFLLWFYRNTSLFQFSECKEEVIDYYTHDMRGSPQCRQPTEGINMMYTVIWVMLLVMILFNNFLIIISIFKVPHLRCNVANLFIASLSFSDLFVGLSVIPIKIGVFSSNRVFCYSYNVCRIYLMSDSAAFTISIINLLVIAIDRHLALNYPYKYPNWMTRRRAKLTIVAIWVYGFCSSVLINFKLDNIGEIPFLIEQSGICRMNHNYILVFIQYTVHFFVPVIVMGVIYFRILRITKNHARNISESIILNNNNVFKAENNNNNNNNNSSTTNNNANNSPVILISMKVMQKDQGTQEKKDTAINNEHYTIENKHSDKAMADLYKRSKSSLRRSSSKSMDQYRRIVRKAAQTVAAVYGTYVFCWLPMAIFSILLMVSEDAARKINPTVYVLMIHYLPLVNSMMNAFLYAIMNSQLRKGFKIVLGVDKIKAYFKLVLSSSSK